MNEITRKKTQIVLLVFMTIVVGTLNVCYIIILPEYKDVWDTLQHFLFLIPNIALLYIWWVNIKYGL